MRLLVFDYDGVLVDSYDVFKRHFLDACRSQGIAAVDSEADFLSLFDGNFYESMLQQGMSRDEILAVVLAVRDGIIEESDAIEFFPGIHDVVHTLADDNSLAVVTSNDTRVVRHFLAARDIDCFDAVIGSDKEPSKHAKLMRLSRQHRDTCHYIGDTVGDILEGKKAGVSTIAATWGWHDERRIKQAEPDHVAGEPADLLGLFSD